MIGGKYSAVIGRETRFFGMCPVSISRLSIFFSQSQRRISPRSSNQRSSPDDSVNYSGWPLPLLLGPGPRRCARNVEEALNSDSQEPVYYVGEIEPKT